MNNRIYRIQDLDQNERPRERLAEYGPAALSEAELLAIILRVGVQGESAVMVGQRLLKNFGGLSGLHRASYEEVCQEHGLGQAKAAQIKAAIEIGNRLAKQRVLEDQSVSFHSPEEVAQFVQYEMAVFGSGTIARDTFGYSQSIPKDGQPLYRIIKFFDGANRRIIQRSYPIKCRSDYHDPQSSQR